MTPPQPTFRSLRLSDEAEALAAHATVAVEGFDFLLERGPEDEPWSSYLGRLADTQEGRNLPDGWVPATFLVAEVDGRIAGRISVRHSLNDWLSRVGGHVGYAVLPEFRRRGVAVSLLRHGLTVLADRGLEEALLTCDDSNTGSAAVIERCGGRLESVIDDEGAPRRRYWVPTTHR